ncbi:MAG: undecaprenyl-diphosphate phosphatase [bacterium]
MTAPIAEAAHLGYGSSVILGLVQGLTEFLPISSSGHLVLAQELLHVNEPGIVVEIALHVGTLVAVFIYFWREIAALVRALPATIAQLARLRMPSDPHGRMTIALVVGTIPAAVAAVLWGDAIEASFESVRDTLIQLAITGAILQLSRIKIAARHTAGAREGLIVGIAQAISIIPGISRSACTITAGVFAGMDREAAARFSMLLVIPAILGATVLAIPDILEPAAGAQPGAPAIGGPLLVGVAVAFVSGLLALRLLFLIARKNRFDVFSWYLWIVAALGLAFMR